MQILKKFILTISCFAYFVGLFVGFVGGCWAGFNWLFDYGFDIIHTIIISQSPNSNHFVLNVLLWMICWLVIPISGIIGSLLCALPGWIGIGLTEEPPIPTSEYYDSII